MVDVSGTATPYTEAHFRRLKSVAGVFMALVVAAVVAGFFLPHRTTLWASPSMVTLVTLAACLWLGFTANGDARARTDRIKREFAAKGDLQRLLRGHLLVYTIVLIRLLSMALAGLVSAVWGRGPVLSLPFFVLAAAMMLMSWPSRHKLQLLIDRAEQWRG